jgi:acyl-CoA reductase-like NAD-dependent aldehyde dehydrogenase
VTQETFGPTVTVTSVVNLAEAVSFANAGRYGLGSAVFTKDRIAGLAAARSLRTGMTSVNSALGFVQVPALPYGGVGESGFGRIHGADGLREFTRSKAITRQRMRPLLNVTSFSRSDRDMRRIVTLMTLLHGRLYRSRGSRRNR